MTVIRPYGDTTGDGRVQLSFTLPVPFGDVTERARAEGAAVQLAAKMGLEPAMVVHAKGMGPDFTYFIVYGRVSHLVDLSQVTVAEREFPLLPANEINLRIRSALGRKLVVLGACIGTDAHTVGIDAILNVKGHAGEKGLEYHREMRVVNLGSQVLVPDLVARGRAEHADAVLVSQVVTQKDAHLANARQLSAAFRAAYQDGAAAGAARPVLVVGGPRFDPAMAGDLGVDIAQRSAKHSAEFMNQAPEVLERLRRSKDPAVTKRGIELAAEFAARAGGIAADAWTALPVALANLNPTDALRLLESTVGFLERGGGSALQVLITGGEILRTLPEIFDEWLKLLWTVAKHGNASLVAFVRSSPRFVRGLASQHDHARLINLALRVIKLANEIAETDGEAALACFRSSSLALRTVQILQFEQWARSGLAAHNKDARARRSYFALETRGSYDALRSGRMRQLELGSLRDVPEALIRARVAAGLTQKGLAERLGLKQQQVQRYEATRYAGVSLERLQSVADALGVQTQGRMLLTMVSAAGDKRRTGPAPA